jgi:shikimate kinase
MADSERAGEGAAGGSLPKRQPKRIVLTGFMGAGKSTVGHQLARRLQWQFTDVDAEIELATGLTIAQLFARHGEAWFRQLEHETILQLVNRDELVLALGGGAIEDGRTRSKLLGSDDTVLIHLEASLETVLKRCQGTEADRPVLGDRENLEIRYSNRLPLYRESHLTVTVDTLPPSVVVDRILTAVSLQ